MGSGRSGPDLRCPRHQPLLARFHIRWLHADPLLAPTCLGPYLRCCRDSWRVGSDAQENPQVRCVGAHPDVVRLLGCALLYGGPSRSLPIRSAYRPLPAHPIPTRTHRLGLGVYRQHKRFSIDFEWIAKRKLTAKFPMRGLRREETSIRSRPTLPNRWGDKSAPSRSTR